MTHDDGVEKLIRLAGPREQMAPDRAARVRAAAHDAWRTSVRARARHRWIITAGLAATASLTVVILSRPRLEAPTPVLTEPMTLATAVTGHVRLLPTGESLRVNAPVRPGIAIETADRAFSTLALGDGGEVRLDAGTLVRFTGMRTLALERGALYFDSRDVPSAEPLRIETPAGVVRDTGTRFEVRLIGGDVRVRVRDGAIRLERAETIRDAPAGQELRITSAGAVSIQPVAVFGAEWDWVTRAARPFRVEGARLSTFLRWVSREGAVTVAFEDGALEASSANTTIHGSVEGMSVAEALAAILPACGLDHRVRDGRVFITRAGQPARTRQ